jgi:hypothetical protein
VLYSDTPIGSHHSLSDLVSYDDVFFFIFGRYENPVSQSV